MKCTARQIQTHRVLLSTSSNHRHPDQNKHLSVPEISTGSLLLGHTRLLPIKGTRPSLNSLVVPKRSGKGRVRKKESGSRQSMYVRGGCTGGSLSGAKVVSGCQLLPAENGPAASQVARTTPEHLGRCSISISISGRLRACRDYAGAVLHIKQ